MTVEGSLYLCKTFRFWLHRELPGTEGQEEELLNILANEYTLISESVTPNYILFIFRKQK